MNSRVLFIAGAGLLLMACPVQAQRVFPQGIGVSGYFVEGIGLIDATSAGVTLNAPALRTMAPSVAQLMGLNPTTGAVLADTNNLLTLAPRMVLTDSVQPRTAGADLLFRTSSGSPILTLGNDGVIAGNGSGLTSLNANQLAGGSVPAARMPALSGDVTTSAGSTLTTLANSGVTAGTYGNAATVPAITVDSKGRVTAVTATAISGVVPGGGAGGDLSGSYPNPGVASVGGKTAAAVAGSVSDTTAATSVNTASTIVRRDGSGNFTAGTITAALAGNATSATSVSGTVGVANGGTGATTAGAALNNLLPAQAGNSGKFLTTDGATASWGSAGGGGTPFVESYFISYNNSSGNGTYYLTGAGGAYNYEDGYRLVPFTTSSATLRVAMTGAITTSYTLTVRKATPSGGLPGTDTTISCTVSPSARTASASGSLSLAAGDLITIKLTGTQAINVDGKALAVTLVCQ